MKARLFSFIIMSLVCSGTALAQVDLKRTFGWTSSRKNLTAGYRSGQGGPSFLSSQAFFGS
jgi:hypothetical protein